MKTTANNNKSHQELKGLSKKKIIAVTKKQTIEKVQFAIDCGIYKIGENQIQEAEKKFKKFKNRKKIELHFIGKLQSNKIKKAVYLVSSHDKSTFMENKNSKHKGFYGFNCKDYKNILSPSFYLAKERLEIWLGQTDNNTCQLIFNKK